MAATPGRATIEPQPLASLPPSPVEEDIGGASPSWRDEDEPISKPTVADGGGESPHKKRRKSKDKGKARGGNGVGAQGSYKNVAEESSDEGEGEVFAGYPPTNDEEAESRQVEAVRYCYVPIARKYCLTSFLLELTTMGDG